MVIDAIERNLNKAYMKKFRRSDGTIGEFLTAKRGNSTYAWRCQKRFSVFEKNLLQGAVDFSISFITLVVPCNKSHQGCWNSWRAVSKALVPYLKALRKKGIEKYLAVLEATSDGACHVHILAGWDRPLQVSTLNDKYYLAEKELSKLIRKRWANEWAKVSERSLDNNAVSIRVCPNLLEAQKAFGYATKYLGKGSEITNTLYRVRNGKATPSDLAKLFSNYFAYQLHIRLWRASKNLGRRVVDLRE